MIRALTLAALAVLLMSCEDGRFGLLRGGDAAPAPAAADSDAAAEAAAETDAAGTDPADAAQPETETAPADTAAPAPRLAEPRGDAPSEAQTACEARGGSFVTLGASGARVCQTRTRDANKVCTASNQCEGACLARSATCAPVTPLLGCNDIITDSGGMATVCID